MMIDYYVDVWTVPRVGGARELIALLNAGWWVGDLTETHLVMYHT